MTTCPTVRIQSDAKGHEGGVIINEADYDPKRHRLFVAAKPAHARKLFIAKPKK